MRVKNICDSTYLKYLSKLYVNPIYLVHLKLEITIVQCVSTTTLELFTENEPLMEIIQIRLDSSIAKAIHQGAS